MLCFKFSHLHWTWLWFWFIYSMFFFFFTVRKVSNDFSYSNICNLGLLLNLWAYMNARSKFIYLCVDVIYIYEGILTFISNLAIHIYIREKGWYKGIMHAKDMSLWETEKKKKIYMVLSVIGELKSRCWLYFSGRRFFVFLLNTIIWLFSMYIQPSSNSYDVDPFRVLLKLIKMSSNLTDQYIYMAHLRPIWS